MKYFYHLLQVLLVEINICFRVNINEGAITYTQKFGLRSYLQTGFAAG